MEFLNISSIELYRSFKDANYSLASALAELIQASVNVFNQYNNLNSRSVIILFWDFDNQKVQIMDNSNGINQVNDLANLWYSFDKPNPYNHHLISSLFYLGKNVSIESKNGNRALFTDLDINGSLTANARISFYNNDEILRIFNTGNRITINDLYHELDINDIHQLYKYLSFSFKHLLNSKQPSIIFSVLKDGLFIDPSNNDYVQTDNIANVSKLHFKLPEYNNLKSFDKDLEINLANGTVLNCSIFAYQFLINQPELNGISFSNKQRTFLNNEQLYKPMWLTNQYERIYVDVIINDLKLDLFNTNIVYDNHTVKKIYESIKNEIEALKIDFPKTFTQPLVTPEINKTKPLNVENSQYQSLKESERYLTSAFNITSKYGTFNDFEIIKDKLQFTYNADDGKKIKINLIKSKATNNQPEWIQINPLHEDKLNQSYEYDLQINLNHPYFRDFISDPETLHKLEHFVVCYAIAEVITRLDGSDVIQLKYEINKLLWGNDDDF